MGAAHWKHVFFFFTSSQSLLQALFPLNIHARVKWILGSYPSNKKQICPGLHNNKQLHPAQLFMSQIQSSSESMLERNLCLGPSLDLLEGKTSPLGLLAKMRFASPVASRSNFCCPHTGLKDILNVRVHHPINCKMDGKMPELVVY